MVLIFSLSSLGIVLLFVKVDATSPIMEAFGNAKTLLNDNRWDGQQEFSTIKLHMPSS